MMSAARLIGIMILFGAASCEQADPARTVIAGDAADATNSSLAEFLQFTDPKRCEHGEPLREVFHSLWRWDEGRGEAVSGGPVEVPGQGLVTPKFERRDEGSGSAAFSSSIPLEGRWHGLQLRRLHSQGYEYSDGLFNEIHFTEPPEKVRAVLNRHGFDLSEPGIWQDIPGNEGAIAILARPDGSALVCS
jgi:hypothetical protein